MLFLNRFTHLRIWSNYITEHFQVSHSDLSSLRLYRLHLSLSRQRKFEMLRTESKEQDNIKTEEAYDEFQIGGKCRTFLHF
jgi:hypothetical protein